MFDFVSILPSNSTAVERALEAAIALAKPDLTPVRALMDPETCPVHLMDYLAWSFSVDHWEPSWPENIKRQVLAASIDVHRIKGTPSAVTSALNAAGFGGTLVIEGYGADTYDGSSTYDGTIDYGEPDHWAEYRLFMSQPISIKQAAQVRAILKKVTPVHEHLKGFFFEEVAYTYDGSISYDGQYTYGVV